MHNLITALITDSMIRGSSVFKIHSSRRKLKVNFAVRQDFGLEFLAKAKPLRPRPKAKATFPGPRPRPVYCKAKATTKAKKAKD